MAHPIPSHLHRAIGAIAAGLLLAACQAAPVISQASPEPAPALDIQRYISLPPAEGALVIPDANDLIAIRTPIDFQLVQVNYPRGLEETVSWTGAGQGFATLRNAHGQVVYRVEQGGEPVAATVPAGEYMLHLEQAPEGLMVVTEVDGPTRLTRRFSSGEVEMSRAGWSNAVCDSARAQLKKVKEAAYLLNTYPLKRLTGFLSIESEYRDFANGRVSLISAYNDYTDNQYGGNWCPDVVSYWKSDKWRQLRDIYTFGEHTAYQYSKWHELLP